MLFYQTRLWKGCVPPKPKCSMIWKSLERILSTVKLTLTDSPSISQIICEQRNPVITFKYYVSRLIDSIGSTPISDYYKFLFSNNIIVNSIFIEKICINSKLLCWMSWKSQSKYLLFIFESRVIKRSMKHQSVSRKILIIRYSLTVVSRKSSI